MNSNTNGLASIKINTETTEIESCGSTASGCKHVIDKDLYLSDPNVNSFVTYFAGLITGTQSFNHGYYHAKTKKTYSFTSFMDAARKYTDGKRNLLKTNRYLNILSKNLQKGIKHSNELSALKRCVKILVWGGVTNGAYGVTRLFLQKNLTSSIKNACDEMNKPVVCLDQFKGSSRIFEMNSSFTKIYALFSPATFIIFDSRVSAALQLLVKNYWLKYGNGLPLPKCLAFPELEHRGQTKDASDKDNNIVFLPIDKNNKSLKHAEWNVKANWIVEAALKKRASRLTQSVRTKNPADQMRAVETALFMIGYKM